MSSADSLSGVDESVAWYLSACSRYQVHPSSDVLTFLRHQGDTLRICRYTNRIDGWRNPPFSELDLHPLVELLQKEAHALGRLRVLDLSGARGLGPSGALEVADLVGRPQCHLRALNLSGQRPGVDGVRALVGAVRRSSTLKSLEMRACYFGDGAGSLFASLLQEGPEVHGLEQLDLENNSVGHDVCTCIEQAAKGQEMRLTLVGNRVLDEVLNAISHGLGCLFAIVGTVFLGLAVKEQPRHCKMAVVLYCIALNVLYFASTLYHSFHALGKTVVRVFGVLDHCAIYLLIAGSYCPFLAIFFPGQRWAQSLLVLLWSMALTGMAVTAFYNGPRKMLIELSLYLGMGWSCVTCLGDMVVKLGPSGSRLLVLGGLCYTGGVPFFVRGGRTFKVPNHTLWHLFVLAGSVAHYFCILWYCAPTGVIHAQLQ